MTGMQATAAELRQFGAPRGAEVLSAVQDVGRQIAKLQAEQVRLLAEFVRLRPGRPGQPFSEFAADEVQAAMRWTHTRAHGKLHEAVTLTQVVPQVLTALESGVVDDYQASILADAVHDLPPEAAAQVADYVLARAEGRNASELKRVIRRAVLRFDATRAEEKRARAHADRRVVITPQDDGMAQLWAYLPGPEAVAIDRRLSAFAREAAPGDERILEQRRADALVDILLDRALGTVTVNVDVTVPATTLTGAGSLPGEVAGYGSITAGHARELAAGARLAADPKWRRFVTQPMTGELIEATPGTYRPSPVVAEFVRSRDRYCVFPGCSWPARSCDIDHRVPYPEGSTTADNLNPLCRHHHRLKHEPGWTLEKRDNRYVWTTPDGTQYTKEPEPVAEPEPEPAPEPPPPPEPEEAPPF